MGSELSAESYHQLFLNQILSNLCIHGEKATKKIFLVVKRCVGTTMPV